jgi:hypothetical protein
LTVKLIFFDICIKKRKMRWTVHCRNPRKQSKLFFGMKLFIIQPFRFRNRRLKVGETESSLWKWSILDFCLYIDPASMTETIVHVVELKEINIVTCFMKNSNLFILNCLNSLNLSMSWKVVAMRWLFLLKHFSRG